MSHHPPARCEEISLIAIRSRVSPFVAKRSPDGTFVTEWAPVQDGRAATDASHRSPRETAWSTSFWTDGSSGPSGCGSGWMPNVAANSIAKPLFVL